MPPYCQDAFPFPRHHFIPLSRLPSSSPVSYAGLVKYAACGRILGQCRLCIPSPKPLDEVHCPRRRVSRHLSTSSIFVVFASALPLVVPSPCYRWCWVIYYGMYSNGKGNRLTINVGTWLCQCHHSCVKLCSATEVVLILRFQLVVSSSIQMCLK
jgi:hypothetical protein